MKYLIAPVAIAMIAAAPAAAQVMAPLDYVAAAGSSDLYERTSSQLVLETTQNPKIRDFARMMIQHHAKSTADVKAAAAKSRVKAPPPKLMPAHAELIAQLRTQTGTARNTTYLTQQREAHNQALALHQSYATNGTAPALRETAAQIVPVVQQHIEMLKTM